MNKYSFIYTQTGIFYTEPNKNQIRPKHEPDIALIRMNILHKYTIFG